MSSLIKITTDLVDLFRKDGEFYVNYSIDQPGRFYNVWLSDDEEVKVTKCFGFKPDGETSISETHDKTFSDLYFAVEFINQHGDDWLYEVESSEYYKDDAGFTNLHIDRKTVGRHDIKPVVKTKLYRIPVYYTVYGYVEVECESLDKAMETAMYGDIGTEDVKDGEYLDDSWAIGGRDYCKNWNIDVPEEEEFDQIDY